MKNFVKKTTQALKNFWSAEFSLGERKIKGHGIISAIIIGIVLMAGLYFLYRVGFEIAYLAILRLTQIGIIFIKGIFLKMTFKSVFALAFKRYVIDFIVGPFVKKRIMPHFGPVAKERIIHTYQNIRVGIKGLFTVIIGFLGLSYVIFTSGIQTLATILAFVLKKLGVAQLFKFIWAALAWLKLSPLGALLDFIIQVIIFGWIIDRISSIIPQRVKNALIPIFEKGMKVFWWTASRFDYYCGDGAEKLAKKVAQKISVKRELPSERLKQALEQKKQKQEQKTYPSARITRFRKEDKNCTRFSDQWRR